LSFSDTFTDLSDIEGNNGGNNGTNGGNTGNNGGNNGNGGNTGNNGGDPQTSLSGYRIFVFNRLISDSVPGQLLIPRSSPQASPMTDKPFLPQARSLP
jgi:hypothetical protein